MLIENRPYFPVPKPRPAGPVFKADNRFVDPSRMAPPPVAPRKRPTLAQEFETAKIILAKWWRGEYA